ncbi:Nucleotide exchange factor SIL1 [Nymphon striatum]|nr:Nucleotide exchange factor SIL1 [Nymphon striatum]
MKMKFDSYSYIFIIFLSFHFVSSNEKKDVIISPSATLAKDESLFSIDSDEEKKDIFIPSKEWKVIKEDQSIPPGLHVRINLSTGLKEAKLMDESETKSESSPQINYDEVKHALKNFKDEGLPSEYEKNVIKSKFRPMNVLKEELEEMNMHVETDIEILKRLLTSLKEKNASDNNTKNLLLEIEYLVHQIDNALNLIELNGLDTIVPILNSTNPELRSLAAFVLGSAMQSNSKVQIAVLEKSVIPQLLRMIAVHSSQEVKTKAMYALSCLVRQFPYAQQIMIENGAFDVFTNVFNDNQLKLTKKVIALIFELIQEKELSLNVDKPNEVQEERAKQYSRVKIKETFVNERFCQLIVKLLPVNDHDTTETVINSMLMLFGECKTEFRSATRLLEELRQTYKILSEKERMGDDHEDDEFFYVLYKNIDVILSKLIELNRNEL